MTIIFLILLSSLFCDPAEGGAQRPISPIREPSESFRDIALGVLATLWSQSCVSALKARRIRNAEAQRRGERKPLAKPQRRKHFANTKKFSTRLQKRLCSAPRFVVPLAHYELCLPYRKKHNHKRVVKRVLKEGKRTSDADKLFEEKGDAGLADGEIGRSPRRAKNCGAFYGGVPPRDHHELCPISTSPVSPYPLVGFPPKNFCAFMPEISKSRQTRPPVVAGAPRPSRAQELSVVKV